MLVPRGKVTGGTSAINGQMFIRGVPEDYDRWAAAGNDQWQFETCLDYLIRLGAVSNRPSPPDPSFAFDTRERARGAGESCLVPT